MENHQRILIIEDDPAIAGSLSSGLEHHGFRPSVAATGARGVEIALQSKPHLILLDVRLPDGSGFDFCRQMRQAGLRQPIVILTAQQDEVDKVIGLEVGADDYVTKPYSLRELVSRLRAHIRRAYGDYSNPDSPTLLVGDLVIDQEAGRVSRGDQSILLTPTEFRMLVYFARHRGQALTRAQVVEAVWGHSPDPDSEKTVNVHIRHLREKIEPDPERPSLLLTVPGIGYRLVE
jgi:DNA-binding response OmpR family regulator